MSKKKKKARNFLETYQCDGCGAKDCKLWRDYNTFLSHLELFCGPCAAARTKGDKDGDTTRDISTMNDAGLYESKYGPTDQIGFYVPAAPTAEGDTFWGYTSVPQDRVEWWQNLPNLPGMSVADFYKLEKANVAQPPVPGKDVGHQVCLG